MELYEKLPSTDEQQWIDMINHYAQDRGLYIKDMQRLIDFFLIPEGKGYEIVEHVKAKLTQVMNAYSELTQLRGNPYQALVEISLLPLSHWASYVKRQKELVSRRA